MDWENVDRVLRLAEALAGVGVAFKLAHALLREKGRENRYNEKIRKKGNNVNFVSPDDGFLNVRTYERGVEDETLSCGTGVTACAIAAHAKGIIKSNGSKIKTPGGKLEVYFEPNKIGYKNVWLEGPATLVFKGEINV